MIDHHDQRTVIRVWFVGDGVAFGGGGSELLVSTRWGALDHWVGRVDPTRLKCEATREGEQENI